jgi:hypothetical protein
MRGRLKVAAPDNQVASKSSTAIKSRSEIAIFRFDGSGGSFVSEYVEARYVKLALQEARSAEPSVAAKLIYDLLRDLGSLQRLSEAREQALKSIQLLALSLARRSIHAREWDAANKATDAWCESALN